MTTSPITSITDELLAELEAAAKCARRECCGESIPTGVEYGGQREMMCCGAHAEDNGDVKYFQEKANPATILALLAERAELKSDIKEYAEAFNKLAGNLARIAIGSGEIESTNNLDDLLAWLEPAINERAELKKDAERYRWLRNPDQDVSLVLDKVTGHVPVDRFGGGGYPTYEYRAGEDLDQAIDQAMQEAKP